MAATAALREALNEGISSGNFIDAKIVLYSHRDSSGRICRPKALYANSHVLKTVPYFNDLLFGNFAESQSKDIEEKVDEEGTAEDYGYLSDSDLEEDEDERVSPFKDTPKSTNAHPPNPPATPGEEHKERVGKGKVVKISDVAFVTFQAFLMYLYTGVIEFAPFGSEENRRSRRGEIIDPSDDTVPRPSPKSIYRLADKYDVPTLKTLALNHIRGQLGKCDIVEEAFSTLASQYDEIRSPYVQQLAYTWVEDSTGATRASVNKKIDSFVEGDIEHATEALFALLENANKDGNIYPPENRPPHISPVESPTHWDFVKIALIKATRNGVFFDRKYWARHSKGGGGLKPIYFSSTIMSDKSKELNDLVKYLEGRNHLASDVEGNDNVESDCDGDLPGIGGGSQISMDLKEGETRVVLITGSHSAWKSLFFYRCTDEIRFAPLKSQGVEYRLNRIREETKATAPPPCSPKSIYVLANSLGIQPLRDNAFADIKVKVTLDNVVSEIFSPVTASQEEIMEVQWDLVISNFKDPKIIALVKETMRRTSDGSSSHCAPALKLGLKRAFDFKMYVGLRCPVTACPWHTSDVPRSFVGSSTDCCKTCVEQDRGLRLLECSRCGKSKKSDCATCRNCGRRFIYMAV